MTDYINQNPEPPEDLNLDRSEEDAELTKKFQLLKLIHEGKNSLNPKDRNKKVQEQNAKKIADLLVDVEPSFLFKIFDGVNFSLTSYSVINHVIEAHNKPALKVILNKAPGLANHYLPRARELPPLLLAAKMDSIEMVKTLLERGADPTQPCCDIKHRTEQKDTLNTLYDRMNGFDKLYPEELKDAVSALPEKKNTLKIKELINQKHALIQNERAKILAKIMKEGASQEFNYQEPTDQTQQPLVNFHNSARNNNKPIKGNPKLSPENKEK